MWTQSAVTVAAGFGLSFPAMANAAIIMQHPTTVGFSTAAAWNRGYANENGTNSVICRGLSAIVSAVTYVMMLDGVFNVSTGGTIQWVANTTVSGAVVHILKGSYIRAYKIG